MKKIGTILLGLCLTLALTACGNDAPTDPSLPAPGVGVQTITGYIVVAEDGLHFDAVELVTAEDTDRIAELGLEEQRDYPSGYAIINEEQEEEVLPFADQVQFQFVDVNLDFLEESEQNGDRVYKTNQVEEFLTHLGEQNKRPLTEQTIPYFVEVQDGKVIQVEERMEYTI